MRGTVRVARLECQGESPGSFSRDENLPGRIRRPAVCGDDTDRYGQSSALAIVARDVKIATSGTYRDRLQGQTFDFATEPLQRTFEYRATKHGSTRNHRGEPVEITAKADDVEHVYFEPSPFTTWEIAVPESLNPHLALDNISEVALEFHGTYIGSRLMRVAADPYAAEPPHPDTLDITIL